MSHKPLPAQWSIIYRNELYLRAFAPWVSPGRRGQPWLVQKMTEASQCKLTRHEMHRRLYSGIIADRLQEGQLWRWLHSEL